MGRTSAFVVEFELHKWARFDFKLWYKFVYYGGFAGAICNAIEVSKVG